ncbi:hypothetical protein STRAU_7666 [Streptomyces aurantiacus JA 4570]|uniref:Uncharacterized protein n=1 Tax=Streptomyces aurantiacus JA 4570 TaxID=1286094 RepID=S3Z828_9ACTN|nr:hypothetical protein STRAU_7666 [Streptomyces aurantiacus JA 4570]
MLRITAPFSSSTRTGPVRSVYARAVRGGKMVNGVNSVIVMAL